MRRLRHASFAAHARTLADLDQSDGVRRIHVAEALSYRRILLGGDLLGR